MGKSKPSAPAPVIVNPQQSATQQASFNKDAALQQRALNMVDQYSPQGSVKYSATGEEIEGIPQYQVTQSFSPEQQELYDLSTSAAQKYGDIGNIQLDKVRGAFESPFSLEAMGAAPTPDAAYRQDTLDKIIIEQGL